MVFQAFTYLWQNKFAFTSRKLEISMDIEVVKTCKLACVNLPKSLITTLKRATGIQYFNVCGMSFVGVTRWVTNVINRFLDIVKMCYYATSYVTAVREIRDLFTFLAACYWNRLRLCIRNATILKYLLFSLKYSTRLSRGWKRGSLIFFNDTHTYHYLGESPVKTINYIIS